MAYIPKRNIPVIVQNRDALESIAGMLQATGAIVFSANPTDGKSLTIYGTAFKFLEEVTGPLPDAIPVQIGDDAEETRDSAIIALAALPRVQTDTLLVDAIPVQVEQAPGIILRYWEVGTVGNSTITTDDEGITVAGMSGGTDGGLIRVQVAGFEAPDIDIGDVNLLNVQGEKIDPATEDMQDDIISAVQVIGTPLQRDPGAAATGSVTVLSIVDLIGETVTISDGTTQTIFEFVEDAEAYQGENIPVEVGNNANQAGTNLTDAVNESLLTITADGNSPAVAVLLNDLVGAAGNVAITTTATEQQLTIEGMSGGKDPVTSRMLGERLASILAAVLTDAQLRAAPVPVSGTVTASGPVTNAELRLAPVPVADSMTTLSVKTVTVPTTAGGVTIQSLSTGGVLQTGIKRITLVPSSTISLALGEAAVVGTNDLLGSTSYQFACAALTDFRVIAAVNTAMLVVQEGLA